MMVQSRISRRQFLSGALVAGTSGLAMFDAKVTATESRSDNGAMPYKIGIYTRPWGQYDYRVALDAIAAAGFQHAGLMSTTMPWGRLVLTAETPPERAAAIGDEVKKRGLDILSVYPGSIPVQKSVEAGIAAMRKIVDNCVIVGAQSILMGGIGKPDLYDAYYKAIAETCDYAAERNMPITVKPHGGLNATGSLCRKCIETVNHDNFSLWYDPGNIFFYSNGELDPVEDARHVDGLVKVGMCIKDFEMPLVNGKPTRNVLVTPGTGRVNFPEVLAVLGNGGFTRGALVIECVHPGDGSLATILAEAKKARTYVEGLARSC